MNAPTLNPTQPHAAQNRIGMRPLARMANPDPSQFQTLGPGDPAQLPASAVAPAAADSTTPHGDSAEHTNTAGVHQLLDQLQQAAEDACADNAPPDNTRADNAQPDKDADPGGTLMSDFGVEPQTLAPGDDIDSQPASQPTAATSLLGLSPSPNSSAPARSSSAEAIDTRAADQAITEHNTSGPTAHGSAASRTSPESHATPRSHAPQIERYELLEIIGQGGMGAVWKARQLRPVERMVAIKLIQDPAAGAEWIRRFVAEQQTMARMSHPEIAGIIDAGKSRQGQPYLVMDLARGCPLDQYCLEQRLTIRQRIKLVARIARALEHAHQQGVVHRDLKPANILVDGPAEQPEFKIIDFGISKVINEPTETDATRAGQILGTPHFMSPEQADLTQTDIDGRTDVYSLGVVLFQLLTDETPLAAAGFRGARLVDILQAIPTVDVPRPSAVLKSPRRRARLAAARNTTSRYLKLQLRPDLDWLVLKSLAKSPDDRYPTMGEFASDIEGYLEMQPISAHPPSRLYRISKWMQRSRSQIAVAATLVAMLVIAAAGIWGKSVWDEQVQINRWQQTLDEANELIEKAGQTLAAASAPADPAIEQSGAASLDESPPSLGRRRQQAAAQLERAGGLLETVPAGKTRRKQRLVARRVQLQQQIEFENQAEQLESQIADAVLLAMEYTSDGDSPAGFTREQGLNALEQAFAEFEMWHGSTGLEQAVTKFKLVPRPLKMSLIEGMHLWVAEAAFRIASVADEPGATRTADPSPPLRQSADSPANDRTKAEWLIRFLNQVDPDPWRQELRAAALAKNRAHLAKLADLNEDQLQRQPPFALLLLANAIGHCGDTAAATRTLEQALHVHRDNVWLNQYTGTVLLYTASPPRPIEAARYLTAAVSLNPDHGGIRLSLAEALLEAGEPAAAEAELRQALEDRPNLRRTQLGLARALTAQQRLSEARRLLQGLHKAHPTDILVVELLGAVLFEQGEWQQSEQLLQLAADQQPRQHQPQLNLARLYAGAGREQAAIEVLSRALQSVPAAAFDQGLAAASASCSAPNVDSAPIGPGYWTAGRDAETELAAELGNAFLRANNPSAAIEYLQFVVRCRPADPAAWFDLALAYHHNRQWKLAAEGYRQVLKLQPHHAEAADYLRQLDAYTE